MTTLFQYLKEQLTKDEVKEQKGDIQNYIENERKNHRIEFLKKWERDHFLNPQGDWTNE